MEWVWGKAYWRSRGGRRKPKGGGGQDEEDVGQEGRRG